MVKVTFIFQKVQNGQKKDSTEKEIYRVEGEIRKLQRSTDL